MKNRRYSLFSKLLVLISLLLMLFGLAQDLPLVLCFEPNGQVELEAATDTGSCVDWSANVRPLIGKPQVKAVTVISRNVAGVFHHCLDLPLSRLSAADRVYKASLSNPAQWMGVWLLYRVIESTLAVTELAMAGSPSVHWAKSPPLVVGQKILRTVILLI